LPKKIKFDLLLADLALQLGNAPAHRKYLRQGSSGAHRVALAAAAQRSARGGRPRPRKACGPPARKRSRQAYKSLRDSLSSRPKAHILARQKPANDAELELSAENTGRLGLGHKSSLWRTTTVRLSESGMMNK
jgi:hypothetical protein